MKTKFFLLTIIITLLKLLKAEVTFQEFVTSLDNYPDDGNFNAFPKLLIFMKIIPPKTKKQRNKIEYNGKIIENFIRNLGVRNEVINIDKQHYVSIINASQKDYFQTDLILETFKDMIEKINIVTPDLFRKQDHESREKLQQIQKNAKNEI